jgi:CRP-like cAMP-binding protein
MLEQLKEGLSQFTFLGPGDLIELASIIRLKSLKKGEHLVRVGDYNYQAVKVIKGLLCHYVIDENGFERALLFVPEKMNSGSMKTSLYGKPADENIVALEDTLMISADVRKLDDLAAKNPRILKMLNDSYKQIIAESAERIRFLIVNTPEERYIHFRTVYPDLEQRIKQKDLSSYLGVTVSSLSRIRARLARA